MTLFAAFTDSIAAGTRFSLATSDTLCSSPPARRPPARGALVGNANGIVAGDDGAQDFHQNIVVAATGEITSYKATGIRVNARFRAATATIRCWAGQRPITSWVISAPT